MTRQRAIFGLAAVAIILAIAVSRPALAQAVKVNTASEAELAGVKGIGKKLAAKIVAKRPYASAAELSKAGVSQKKIDKIAPMLSFEGGGGAPASAAAASAAPAAAETPAAPEHKSKRGHRESSEEAASA